MNVYIHYYLTKISRVLVVLTLVTQLGIGIVSLTSSTCTHTHTVIYVTHTIKHGLYTTFPIVCLGPTLISNLPVPSENENCGFTYTGKATLLYRDKTTQNKQTHMPINKHNTFICPHLHN